MQWLILKKCGFTVKAQYLQVNEMLCCNSCEQGLYIRFKKFVWTFVRMTFTVRQNSKSVMCTAIFSVKM